MSSAPQLRHAAATVHGRYLVQPPAAPGPAPWLVGFHGYAQSAEVFLPMLTALLPGPHWLTCSVQALHPFYAGRTQAVVANWMTSQDRELAIADNIAYVDAVLEGLVREHGAPRAIVFAGFSQGACLVLTWLSRTTARPSRVLAFTGAHTPLEGAEFAAAGWPAPIDAIAASSSAVGGAAMSGGAPVRPKFCPVPT